MHGFLCSSVEADIKIEIAGRPGGKAREPFGMLEGAWPRRPDRTTGKAKSEGRRGGRAPLKAEQ